MSVRLFFRQRLAFELVNWAKQMAPFSVIGPHPIYWEPRQDTKAEEKKTFISPGDWVVYAIDLPSSDWNLHHWHPWYLGFKGESFSLELELYHWLWRADHRTSISMFIGDLFYFWQPLFFLVLIHQSIIKTKNHHMYVMWNHYVISHVHYSPYSILLYDRAVWGADLK